MTVTVALATTAAPRTARLHAPGVTPTARVVHFELVKLLAQWRVRALLLACSLVPAAFVALVGRQGSLPSDTLFGRWMHASGWAGSLVVLGFAGSWALPLVTSVVAGDVFSSEDRLGTWRHLLVAVRSPRRIFVAKALAALAVVLAVTATLAVSGTIGGLATSGDRPLVGVDGHLLTAADAARHVALAWASVVAPTLALAALGLVGSVAAGRSPIGLLTPSLAAVGMQVAQLAPLPVAVRVALPTSAFSAWGGLFTAPVQSAPLLGGIVVSLAWATVATFLAHRLFTRRDFANVTDDAAPAAAVGATVATLTGLLALGAVVVAVTTAPAGAGITRQKVERSVAVAFAHLYRQQTSLLNRPAVSEAQLHTSAGCTRGGGMTDPSGAGNDWRCAVTWHLPGAGSATGTATYQLDVSPTGRFIADGDGPQEVNGFFLLHTATGDAPNPLWQFDGLVDLLAPPTKG